jgi:hypothetical protein
MTAKNVTLADIEIKDYTLRIIKEMEEELIEDLETLKWQPVMLDPRAEMNKAKREGNTETLVAYEEMNTITEQAC